MRATEFVLLTFSFLALTVTPVAAQKAERVPDVFEPDYRNGLVMDVEAALAGAQAELGLIPQSAANEIAAKADTRFAPLDEIAKENSIVRHRMVALLNVWKRSLSTEAADALHFGATTVDIYDTVLVLQLLESIEIMLDDMHEIEDALACLALEYRDTPMIGRTLGQHALPITFGKKVSVWTAQNRRNIDRLLEVRARLRTSGVLKGAVGTYLGLGKSGMDIERGVSLRLGLGVPEPADWRPARDVFAEYALTLALVSKSNANLGGEIFRMQMTDIGELYEDRGQSAVSSSTMPHKRNPSLSEALIYHGRTVPALAEIILDDVEAIFERDNTSRPNRTMEEITILSAQMLRDTRRLIDRLKVDPDRMRQNIDLTGGMVMSQQVMLFLTPTIGRDDAAARIKQAARRAATSDSGFRDELMNDPVLAPLLRGNLDELLDPNRNLGLAAVQVDRTLDWIDAARRSNGRPILDRSCPTQTQR